MQTDMEQDVETEAEARARAREFILSAIDEGRSAIEILDELTTFYDGDPCDLF
jgi:hypothetical protein